MNIEWSNSVTPAAAAGDVLCMMISENRLTDSSLAPEWRAAIEPLTKAGLFSGKLNQIYILPVTAISRYSIVILAGSGKGDPGIGEIRVLAAHIVRAAMRLKAALLDIEIPEQALSREGAAQALAEGLKLGSERRKHYKQEQASYVRPDKVALYPQQLADDTLDRAWRQGIQRGSVFGDSANLARELTNLPGNLLIPSGLAAAAVEVAERHGLPVEVLDEREIEQKGMGGLLAVGKGSIHPPRMIVIRYQGTGDWTDVTGIIGKGITFDTGGISLKRAPGMEDMISDMGGAAAVLSVMEALGRLRPRINVVMVIPAAENMPSAAAFKPGDIITTLSGKTVEVLNTDAEGRVVLGDGLTYAREWGAERFIDVATLTGAVVSILGDVATGAVTNDKQLMQDLLAASDRSGEPVWQLPVYPEFREMLRSEVADIRNAAGRFGSASTAGLFIGEFAEGLPWVHLDIAGTAFLSKERGVHSKGATGVMVRTLLEYLLSLSRDQLPGPLARE
ncbi:leucyl aminopeptidase [Paenibacillus sp. FSL R7-0331]|uniref:leucyl aminopeptidase n=1 Tax=Paenibacillus sp. FSL R7-0331 TaxID=1536773 RepID=UPI0004F6A34B|nr:leucyl aminopeptidase [Paenibacillus sp. FSL R7-0331]AIQ51199.1 peptidase M17 [Paenibacillus sp. FSL R7-0331]